jgi:hypothetical protein
MVETSDDIPTVPTVEELMKSEGVPTNEEVKSQAEKMLNGRDPTNALLENIAKKGANSYYYAHAPKDFTTEGA